MALSVENCGAAKTPKGQIFRSVRLEATPPEKTTSSPGYWAWAARVSRSTASTTEPMAKAAVSAVLPVF